MKLTPLTNAWLRGMRSMLARGNETSAAHYSAEATRLLLVQTRRHTLALESKVRVLVHLEERALEAKVVGVGRIAADRHTAALRLQEWLSTGTIRALATR